MGQQQAQGVQNGTRGKRILATSARVMAAIVLIAIGLLALIFPGLTGVSAASVAPIFLILGGIIGLFDGLFGLVHEEGGVNWIEALLGLVYLALGFILASSLYAAVFSLGIAVGAGFLAQACVALLGVFTDAGHRLWLLFLAACNALLAWMSFVAWPMGAMELVGIYVGFSFLSWGIALLSGGFHNKAA